MAPVTKKNTVNRLDWNIPITHADGRPTAEFQRKWLQQATTNAAIPDVTTIIGVSAVLDLITAVKGSLLTRGITAWQGLPPATGHDGWLLTFNNTSGLPEWRVPAITGIPAAFWIDGSGVGQMALVDANGVEVLDGSGLGIYIPNPALPGAMIPFILPTVQVLTSGTAATYTPTPGAKWIKVRFSGAGGAGCGGGDATRTGGGNGGDTTFNGIVAKGGIGGAQATVLGGDGGAGGAGAANFRCSGNAGIASTRYTFGVFFATGGNGAGSLIGPGAKGGTGAGAGTAGTAAPANSGGGGGGGGSTAATGSGNGAGGGGSGEYAELILPATTYVYTITAGGVGGTAGVDGLNGGNGGSGVIVVEEYYL